MGASTTTAMLGRVEWDGTRLRLTPRFTLEPGLRYRAVFALPGARAEEMEFEVVAQTVAASTTVSRVIPSTDTIPENLLRVYVEFSAPMSEGDVLPHVDWIDASGTVIGDAFVETPALWDYERRRLTLICHPGRIKRGLDLSDREGAPLAERAEATLRVRSSLRDAGGAPLAREFERRFTIGPADRESPNPARWTIGNAMTGTRDAVLVRFAGAVDPMLVSRMLQVEGADVRAIEMGGAAEIVPRAPWVAGEYALVIDPALEDLCGNRVDAAFESAVGAPRDATPRTLFFTIR